MTKKIPVRFEKPVEWAAKVKVLFVGIPYFETLRRLREINNLSSNYSSFQVGI